MKDFFKFTGASLIVSTIFLGAAILHRVGISNPGYVTSPLIDIEFTLLILIFLSVFGFAAAVVILLLARKWKAAAYVAINLIIVFLVALAGMAIDSPTLIYMT